MIEAESLQWRHNAHDGDSTHQPHDCLLIHLFRRKSKKTSNLRVIGLCVGNSPVTGEFPAQRASNAENVWWRYHEITFSINRCCDADEGWGQLRIWDTCYRGVLWGGVLVWFQVRGGDVMKIVQLWDSKFQFIHEISALRFVTVWPKLCH